MVATSNAGDGGELTCAGNEGESVRVDITASSARVRMVSPIIVELFFRRMGKSKGKSEIQGFFASLRMTT
jgi:hypothetical protein